MKFRYITPLVVAARAAAAIIAAPAAWRPIRATSLQCRAGCHRQRLRDTGNAQINDSPAVQFGPQHPYRDAGWGG